MTTTPGWGPGASGTAAAPRRSPTSGRAMRTSVATTAFSQTASGSARLSDVIHARAGLARLALDHVRERRVGQDLAGGLGGVGEHAVGVAPERSVQQLDDLEHGDGRGLAGKAIAALDAALRADDPGASEHAKQLLEKLHGHFASARQLADRHGL